MALQSEILACGINYQFDKYMFSPMSKVQLDKFTTHPAKMSQSST